MTNSQFDVLGIGNAIVDILSHADDEYLNLRGISKGAMNLIDEERAESLYAETGPAIEVSGGSAANTIAGIASFGGDAAYTGKVRDDQLGGVFSHDIRAAGVTFDTGVATDGPATARCIIFITPDGERTMNTYLGACVNLGPEDLNKEQIEAAQITYMEGYLFDKEPAMRAFHEAGAIAKAAGRKVSLTLSDLFCVERHRPEFLDLVRGHVDILFANEAEIMALYQVDDFDAALAAVRQDCELGALTRSEKGCVVVNGDEIIHVPAVPIEKLVDATGAGDLFAAGFLFGLTNGRDAENCARLGVLAASEVISHVGARPEVPLHELAQQQGLA
ncbi:MAG: adenosine kinase [Hyphomicrobiales bacterium]